MFRVCVCVKSILELVYDCAKSKRMKHKTEKKTVRRRSICDRNKQHLYSPTFQLFLRALIALCVNNVMLCSRSFRSGVKNRRSYVS